MNGSFQCLRRGVCTYIHTRQTLRNTLRTFAGPNGKKVTDVAVEDFDRVYEVNVRGSFNVTKHSIPHMLKHNYGRVLLIASIAGKEGNAV